MEKSAQPSSCAPPGWVDDILILPQQKKRGKGDGRIPCQHHTYLIILCTHANQNDYEIAIILEKIQI